MAKTNIEIEDYLTSINYRFKNIAEAAGYSVKVFCWSVFDDIQPLYKNAVMDVK